MNFGRESLRSIVDPKDYSLWGVNSGITEPQARQLLDYAKDPVVAEFTSDPKRFGDQAALENWLAKGRVIYTLTDQEEDLAGIIWYGREEMPTISPEAYLPGSASYLRELYGTTFAIRTYGEARGRGLAKGFMEVSYHHLQAHWNELMRGTPRSGLWLETSERNYPAKRAYIKFGYEQITEPDSKGKILMVLPKSRTSLNGRTHQ